MGQDYDALVVVSFGGPENPGQVHDFLERVSKGRNIPPRILAEVSERYLAAGGSPANKLNRRLMKQIQKELEAAGISLGLYLGNRNSPPLLEETLKQMQKDGVKKAMAFITSPFASYSSCRQYQENIEAAKNELDDQKPGIQIHRLRHFYNHPVFIQIWADAVRRGLEELNKQKGENGRYENLHILFSAHSLPLTMAENCSYAAQIQNTCELVMDALGFANKWSVSYQSISGNPESWLGPDILDAIASSKAEGADAVLISPVGFLASHMEVLYDLDEQAKEHAKSAGLGWQRADTPQEDSRFAALICQLIQERTSGTERLKLGENALPPDFCPPNCCVGA